MKRTLTMSANSVHNFLSNPVNRQTNTHIQANAGKKILLLAEVNSNNQCTESTNFAP